MSETTTSPTQLASQYSMQVTGDLERNLKEQERVRDEIEALQAQLAALQQDHTILVNIQTALGMPAATTAPETAAAVPAPRRKKAATSKAATKPAKKSAAPAGQQARKKNSSAEAAATAPQPSLIDLVRAYLTGQSEPRSAAEITAALEQQHPERTVKTTVVRTTLENLVAKNQADRTKQGTSVFYTAANHPEPVSQQDEPAAPQAA
ncbi:hypothetical protein ACFCYB_37155 [Streptomyces sp. NPDC056309]|uniref:hypothetical protein n=1 Tax=unclassified Streptomyces TaxID=2593676 RepID=UPI0035DA1005